MHPFERVPAIRRIETDRPDVFAVEITTEVTSSDVENLCGLLEGAYALHERIDLLVRIVDLEDIDVTGLSPDTTRFMKDHVARHVGRCAVVDDAGWASRVERLFAPDAGVEVRRFAIDDEEAAWTWLGAHETYRGT